MPPGASKPSESATQGAVRVGDQSVTWMLDGDLASPRVLLAHGAGAPATHPFMEHVAHGLAAAGAAVVRFNFPYMERGRRAPDRPPVLLATIDAMLAEIAAWKPGPDLVLAGKSMGGRMMSMLLAERTPPGIRGVIYFGYPLRGAKSADRASHLARIAVPQLFVSGSRDALAPLADLRSLVAALPSATLHVVEGGDHSLAVSRRDPFAGSQPWLDAASEFIRRATA